MPIPLSHRTDLLGLTVEGPPPVGEVHLDLGEGVSVLYGLNGAGKSSLLKAIKVALSGRLIDGVDRAAMHLRVKDPNSPLWEESKEACPITARICGLMLSTIKSRLEDLQEIPWGRSFDSSDYPTELRWPSPAFLVGWLALTENLTAEDIREAGGLERLEENFDLQMEKEVAAQGFFSLEAVGETESRWAVFIEAQATANAPVFSKWYDEELAFERWRTTRKKELQSNPVALEQLLEEVAAAKPARQPMWSDTPDRPSREGSNQCAPLPHWAPFPLVEIGEFSQRDTGLIPRLIEEDFDVDDVLVSSFEEFKSANKNQTIELIETLGKSGMKVSPMVKEWLQEHSKSASSIYANLLVDAPELRCSVKNPNRSLRGGPLLHWEAVDAKSRRLVPLATLSQAQGRWAKIAISLSFKLMNDVSVVPAFIVVDEPEQALHPMAERYMTHALRSAADYVNGGAIVATHSRELLNSPDARLTHVFRDNAGATAVATLDLAERERLGPLPLGISPADFFLGNRVILAVEGDHDEIVLKTIIGGELRDSAVRIVKLNGADNLDVVNADLVLNLTEAHLLIALDRVGLSKLPADWKKAQTEDDVEAAVRTMKRYLDNKKSEVQTLASFCIKFLRQGMADRLHVFGFTKPDIVHYLPVTDFVEDAESWEQLTEEWHRSPSLGFKDWLKTAKGVSIKDRLQQSALDMKQEPEEFRKLVEECRRVARLTAPGTGID